MIPLTIGLVGLATYAIRASLFVWPRFTSSPRAQRVLRRVPAAILPTLAISALHAPAATGSSLRLVAAVLAAVVAWRTRNVLATLALGMVALWLLRAVVP